jgi:hypothetical protein
VDSVSHGRRPLRIDRNGLPQTVSSIQKEPPQLTRTTSITENQFEQLTQMIWQELPSATDGGRVVVLTQRDQFDSP